MKLLFSLFSLSSARRFNRLSHAFMSTSAESSLERCTRKIRETLQPSRLEVTSANDDPNGSHIQITCISDMFAGKNAVQRQRLVYKAIWDELQSGEVHAVDSIVAKTPEEDK